MAKRRCIGACLAGLALAVLLPGCEPITVPVDGMASPASRIADPPADPPAAAPVPSEESRRLARYYQGVQDGLVARGLLRTDGGGPDAPFTRDDLVENFLRIALFEEFVTVGGRVVPRQAESQVHKWNQPIRMQVQFGPTVPQDQRAEDRRVIGAYLARLSRLTGLPIRMVRLDPNFRVFIVNEDERKRLAPDIRAFMPGISDAAVDRVVNMPREDFCLVFASDPGDRGSYDKAVAIIRAEHPGLLRRSCIHEEIAQGLGLLNDSPKARPSIFNDDEEFGLLTTQDELFLRMLYDDRMRAGMSLAEARTVAEEIADELMGQAAPTN